MGQELPKGACSPLPVAVSGGSVKKASRGNYQTQKSCTGYGWKLRIQAPAPVGNQRVIRPCSLDGIWPLQTKMDLKWEGMTKSRPVAVPWWGSNSCRRCDGQTEAREGLI